MHMEITKKELDSDIILKEVIYDKKCRKLEGMDSETLEGVRLGKCLGNSNCLKNTC